MPSPRPSSAFALEFSPESLFGDEGEEVEIDDEGEEVGTDDEEGVLVSVEAGDARTILKLPLLNLGVTSPGLKIARKKVEASVTFCFSVYTLQAQELVFWMLLAFSRFAFIN